MVEAALVTPLLMILIFGIIEMALLMKDDVALTSAVRNGGRIASANAGAGPGGVAADDGSCLSPCTPANAPKFAQMAANAIQTAGSALPKDSILELWVYKANDMGYPGPAGQTTWTCGTECVKYKWIDTQGFRYFSGSWASTSVNACANNPPDVVGVYLRAKHTFMTGFFTQDVEIEDHAVFAFEPLSAQNCAPTRHP